jgi:hypothetical protein
MQRKFWLVPLLALGVAAAPAVNAQSQETSVATEASIPFVNHGGIRDWRSGDRETLYVQGRDRQWFKATLMAPAHGLPFAWAIGFDTGPMDRLDRFSSVVVEGVRYPIQSLVKVDGPPTRPSKAVRQQS